MLRQEIIRDINYNIIETIDNDRHVKYHSYYKCDNFEYPSFKITNSPTEQDFIDIVKDGVIRIDKIGYPNCIFLFKNDDCIFSYDVKYGDSWFNDELIWSVLEKKYSMNYREIGEFLRNMIEKHFNCKVIILQYMGKRYCEMIENHFR